MNKKQIEHIMSTWGDEDFQEDSPKYVALVNKIASLPDDEFMRVYGYIVELTDKAMEDVKRMNRKLSKKHSSIR